MKNWKMKKKSSGNLESFSLINIRLQSPGPYLRGMVYEFSSIHSQNTTTNNNLSGRVWGLSYFHSAIVSTF